MPARAPARHGARHPQAPDPQARPRESGPRWLRPPRAARTGGSGRPPRAWSFRDSSAGHSDRFEELGGKAPGVGELVGACVHELEDPPGPLSWISRKWSSRPSGPSEPSMPGRSATMPRSRAPYTSAGLPWPGGRRAGPSRPCRDYRERPALTSAATRSMMPRSKRLAWAWASAKTVVWWISAVRSAHRGDVGKRGRGRGRGFGRVPALDYSAIRGCAARRLQDEGARQAPTTR